MITRWIVMVPFTSLHMRIMHTRLWHRQIGHSRIDHWRIWHLRILDDIWYWHLKDIGPNSPEGLKTSNSSGSRGTWGFIGMTPTYFCIYFTCHVTLLFSRILNNTWIDALHLLISLDNLKYFQSLGSKIFSKDFFAI